MINTPIVYGAMQASIDEHLEEYQRLFDNKWPDEYLDKWANIKTGDKIKFKTFYAGKWIKGEMLTWYTDTDHTTRLAIVQYCNKMHICLVSPSNIEKI